MRIGEYEDVKRYLCTYLGNGEPPAKADQPRKGHTVNGIKGKGDKKDNHNWAPSHTVAKGVGGGGEEDGWVSFNSQERIS